MKDVVIVGGGFAGITACLELERQQSSEAKITLIDKNSYHLFTPSLYEVATSESPQQNIVIPFKKIFSDRIVLKKGVVAKIDPEKQIVELNNKEKLHYDYLILALGSEPAYFAIPGLREKSVAFKTENDALRIKNAINSLCCKEGKCQKKVQAVIGGGGFSGTELACELLSYKDNIAKQNGLDKNCLELTVIQGQDRLLKELDNHVSDLAEKRLKKKNVRLAFGGHVKEVTEENVLTDDGKSYPYDILIWTGGVEANHVAVKSNMPVNQRGQVLVDKFLQVQDLRAVFAAGDIAGYTNPKNQKPVPNVAQVAKDQGIIAGENVLRLLRNKPLREYEYHHLGYVVPMGGHFAAAELPLGLHFDGILGWILQQIIFLYYLLSILPVRLAFQKWNTFEKELVVIDG